MYNTFKPEGIKKPLIPYSLFGKHFKAECEKNGSKFSLKELSVAWKKLPDEEKDKFKKQAADDKAKYNTEYFKQRSDAIKNGIIPADKPNRPKRPSTIIKEFFYEVLPILIKKYKHEKHRQTANELIATEAAEMWCNKYDDLRRAEKEYEEKMKEWQLYENIRQRLPLDKNMIKLLMEKSEERTTLIYHELLAKALHPDRVSKWLDYHLDNGGDICDFEF